MPNKRRSRVTIHDVAKEAGVSHITVSRVVNERDSVAQSTREQVLKAIEKTGYRPNKAAKSLRSGRSNVIAFVAFAYESIPSLQAFNLLTSSQVAHAHGYDIVFEMLPDYTWDKTRDVLNRLMSWPIGGLIIPSTTVSIDTEQVRRHCADIPVLMRETRPNVDGLAVIMDNYAGGGMAIDHLTALGHTRIAELRGPAKWHSARVRHRALVDSLQERNLTPIWSQEAGWTAEAGYEATTRLIKDGVSFTAISAPNDAVVLGVLAALMEHNVRVPQDVSVIGFDNIPQCAYYKPPLTTVNPKYNEFTTAAVEHLLAHLSNPDGQPSQRIIHPELIVRRSTASPAR